MYFRYVVVFKVYLSKKKIKRDIYSTVLPKYTSTAIWSRTPFGEKYRSINEDHKEERSNIILLNRSDSDRLRFWKAAFSYGKSSSKETFISESYRVRE